MKVVHLNKISSPKQWKTIPSSRLLDSGYPVYGANGIIGFYSEYTHEEPTILITCRGATCGTINVSKPKSYVNGNAMALDKLSDEVEINYLKYILQARGLDDVISGSAQPQITRTNLNKVKIPLPPLKTQKQIATILDDAAALRDKTAQLLTEYDALAQSIFLEMFGDPVVNPMGWEKVKLTEAVVNEKNAIVDGPFGSSIKQSDYVEKGIPVIRINNIRNEGFYNSEFKYLNRNKYEELIRSKVNKNDILIARVGNTIGKTCIFNQTFEALLSTTGVAKASIDEGKFNVNFVIKMFSIPTYKAYIKTFVQGAGQPYLNLTKIKSFNIIRVPIHLQNQFAEKITLIEQQKTLAKQEFQEAENLFNCLLQKAFKGELGVE